MGANHDLDALEALFEEETEAFEENSFSLKEENSHGKYISKYNLCNFNIQMIL